MDTKCLLPPFLPTSPSHPRSPARGAAAGGCGRSSLRPGAWRSSCPMAVLPPGGACGLCACHVPACPLPHRPQGPGPLHLPRLHMPRRISQAAALASGGKRTRVACLRLAAEAPIYVHLAEVGCRPNLLRIGQIPPIPRACTSSTSHPPPLPHLQRASATGPRGLPSMGLLPLQVLGAAARGALTGGSMAWELRPECRGPSSPVGAPQAELAVGRSAVVRAHRWTCSRV
jgi:hypothetical protein